MTDPAGARLLAAEGLAAWYGAAQILSMIPATPGGLGFVEAGLVGLLALAGMDAGTAAVAGASDDDCRCAV